MNVQKRSTRWLLWVFLPLLVVVGAACAPSRIGVSWGVMDTLVVNGETRILIGFNQHLNLLDPENGTVIPLLNTDGQVRLDEQGNPRRWDVDGTRYDGAQFFSRPLLVGDPAETLIVPSYNNRLLEIDVQAARVENTAGIPVENHIFSDVIEDETRYYVPMSIGGLVAIDKASKLTVWSFESKDGVWAAPLLNEGVLYVATVDHYLHALSAETGERLWQEPVALGGLAGATPLLYDEHLYIGSYGNELFKISLDGQVIGKYLATNWLWSTPTLYEGLLYIGDLGGSVHAIDPKTMQAVWSAKVAERGIRPAPIVTAQYVIVASRDGVVHWLDRRDGITAFTREIEGRPEVLADLLLVEANPEEGFADTLVLISTMQPSHLVVAFTLENGRAAWVYAR